MDGSNYLDAVNGKADALSCKGEYYQGIEEHNLEQSPLLKPLNFINTATCLDSMTLLQTIAQEVTSAREVPPEK